MTGHYIYNGYVTGADHNYPVMSQQHMLMGSQAGVPRARRRPSYPSDINIQIDTDSNDASLMTPALQSDGTSIGSISQPNTPDRQPFHHVHVVNDGFLCPPKKALVSDPLSSEYGPTYHTGPAPPKEYVPLSLYTRRRSRSTSDVPAAQDNVHPHGLYFPPEAQAEDFRGLYEAPVTPPPSANPEISAGVFQTWRTSSSLSPQSELSSTHLASPFISSSHDFNSSPVHPRFVQQFPDVDDPNSVPPRHIYSKNYNQPNVLQGLGSLNNPQNDFLDGTWLEELQSDTSPSSASYTTFPTQATAPALTGAINCPPMGGSVGQELNMTINSMSYPLSPPASQWRYEDQPLHYYHPQAGAEGSNTTLQVPVMPRLTLRMHGDGAVSIDPARLAEPLDPELLSGLPSAVGSGTTTFPPIINMSVKKRLLQAQHKEAVYEILLQSASQEEAAEKVLGLAESNNDSGFNFQFTQACHHHPKDSATGRQKAEGRRTRDPKFQCILCQDRMTTNNNLQNHYRSHLSLRKFQCPHCFTSFATDSIRARHLRNTVKCPGYNPNAVPRSKKQPSNDLTDHGASGSGIQ